LAWPEDSLVNIYDLPVKLLPTTCQSKGRGIPLSKHHH